MSINYRLQNLYLVARVWGKALIHGRARSVSDNPKSILVFQSAKLGDMVCTTPVFRAIKNKYPDCRLTVVGDVTNKQLLAHHPDVDQYLIWDKSFENLYQQISGQTFDSACLITPNFSALAALFLAGVPAIITPYVVGGWCPFQTLSYRLLLPLVITIPHRFNHYAPLEYLKLLTPLGIDEEDTTKHLYYSKTAQEKISAFLSTNNIDQENNFVIGISVSSGNKVKNWGGYKFAQLADYIYQTYNCTIIIIGGPVDQSEVEELMTNLNSTTKVINTFGLFNLDELQALIAQLKLFISVDTGPIYIAEAFNIPTIDIIGPMNDVEQPPKGPLHAIVAPPEPRIPQLHIMNARVYDVPEALRQTESTTVAMAITVVDVLLSKLNVVNRLKN